MIISSRAAKWGGVVCVVLGVVLGCTSVLEHLAEENSGSPNGEGFALVDSNFSTASASPGGTGGVVEDDPALVGEETRSFFKAFQIDPEAEDTAGPKFVVSADVDQDGLIDLVSGWNESQPVQLHLQRRDGEGNISFRTISIAGTSQVAVMAGVEVGQIDDDGWLDIVVLSKATGFVTLCPPENSGGDPTVISNLDGAILVYFSPGDANLLTDGDRWTEMELINPFVKDIWIHDQYPGKEEKTFEVGKTSPEWNGFTSLAVADIDGNPGDEILVALNPGKCKTLGQDPPTNTVDLWVNPGGGQSRVFNAWGAPDPNNPARNVPVSIMLDAPQVKDIALSDIDGDSDLDILATYTNSISLNIRWARNPQIPHQTGGPSGLAAVSAGVNDGFRLVATQWQIRPIGEIDTAADVMALGDIDGDGFEDVVVRSAEGKIVQWFRRPNELVIAPEFPPNNPVPDRFNFPWPVFTLTEFVEKTPEAISVGDVTGDGRPDLLAAAEGAVSWFDGTTAPSVYDPWFGNTIIQDGPEDIQGDGGAGGTTSDPTATAAGSGVGVDGVDTSTHINALLVVDLDGDGRNDVVGTLDRREGAGLSDDRLVWYRNVRTQENTNTSRPRPIKRRVSSHKP